MNPEAERFYERVRLQLRLKAAVVPGVTPLREPLTEKEAMKLIAIRDRFEELGGAVSA